MDLSSIEQGIKDAIKNLQRPYISSIESYGGDFDDGLNKEVIRRFPAIWTTFQGSGKPEQISARKFRVPLVFVVLVGAYSIRNEEAARTGVEVDGQLVLLNNNLAANGVCGITPFTYGKIDKVFDNRTQTEALSVFAQQWHTTCIVTGSAAHHDLDANAEWVQVVNVDYMFKEGDEVADMSDFIKLPITLNKDN
jgi:hypothetical protein